MCCVKLVLCAVCICAVNSFACGALGRARQSPCAAARPSAARGWRDNPPPPTHTRTTMHTPHQILRNDGMQRPLVVTTVDRLDLVLGLMGAQVGDEGGVVHVGHM